MTTNDIPTIDRLSERGLVDRWGFLLFAFGGGVAILAAKAMSVSAIAVAAGAGITMAVYAALVQTSGTGRLRSDQAGDNCYYLGLIFTLTSLAYAIFFFDPANTATTIVQGFGIALATTIIGLVLRVFFNQSRVDLVDTEDSARIELADAAGRLKAELAGVVVSMNDFSRQTRQSLDELRMQVVQGILEVQQTAFQTISDTAARSSVSVAAQADEVVANSKRLSSATTRIVNSVERHAESLGEVSRLSEGMAASLSALETAAASTRSSMAELSTRATGLESTQQNLRDTGRDLHQVVLALAGHVRAFDETAVRFDEHVHNRLDEVRAAPTEIAESAQSAIERLVEDLKIQFGALIEVAAHAGKILSDRASENAAVAERHNQELERELGRSRENVSKVHSALVDMTGALADQIEGKVIQ